MSLHAYQALERLLTSLGLSVDDCGGTVSFIDNDPIVGSRHRPGAASAAALAALHTLANTGISLSITGRRKSSEISSALATGSGFTSCGRPHMRQIYSAFLAFLAAQTPQPPSKAQSPIGTALSLKRRSRSTNSSAPLQERERNGSAIPRGNISLVCRPSSWRSSVTARLNPLPRRSVH